MTLNNNISFVDAAFDETHIFTDPKGLNNAWIFSNNVNFSKQQPTRVASQNNKVGDNAYLQLDTFDNPE